MPTWATGTSTERRPAERGFSLLELLVVLLIVGVTLTMATLAVGPMLGRDDGDDEAVRLAAVLRLAREQAVLQGAEHGLSLTAEGYRLMALEAEGWTPLVDTALRPRTLRPTTTMRLEVEGRGVALPQEPPDEPQLLLLSSGETTPFVIELQDPATVCRITGDGLAELPPPACDPA
jgi:general secretion pathway protein H